MTKLADKLPPKWRTERELSNPAQVWLNRLLFDLQSPLGRYANLIGVLVIFGSVLLSMAGTIPGISQRAHTVIQVVEITVTLMFILEYFLRLYAGRQPVHYALSFYGLIDLLTWLPLLFLGHGFLAIRLLRIMRLLKLLRYLRALRLLFSSMLEVFDVVFVVLAAIIILVLLSGNLIYYVEPQTFPNAYIGCWWSIVTMSTVGYGDMVPVTVMGKVVAAFLMLTGVAMFALLTGVVTIKLGELLNKRSACTDCNHHISSADNFCSNCGKSLREKVHFG